MASSEGEVAGDRGPSVASCDTPLPRPLWAAQVAAVAITGEHPPEVVSRRLSNRSCAALPPGKAALAGSERSMVPPHTVRWAVRVGNRLMAPKR